MGKPDNGDETSSNRFYLNFFGTKSNAILSENLLVVGKSFPRVGINSNCVGFCSDSRAKWENPIMGLKRH